MSESNGSKSSPTFQHALEQQQHSYHQVTAAVCPSMAIQHQHHHHFYAHHQLATGAAGTAAGAVADVSLQHHQQQQQHHSHHHLHHHHFQQSAAAVAGLTSSTSALSAAASDSTISSISPPFCPNSTTFRCSNRLMTLIVITILPIAITSTLICVFFLQKTNLHQYAIYSFVIFCGAFVFPFALFFFTVILNKIYKFYKREIRSNPRPSEAHLAASFLPPSAGGRGESVDGGGGTCDPLMTDYHGYHHHLLQPGPSLAGSSAASAAVLHQHQHQYQHQHHALPPTVGQNASLICYSSSRGPVQYAHGGHHSTTTTTGTPYYYHLEDGTIVAYASPVHLDHHVSGIEGNQATSVTALPGTVVGTVVLATTATTAVDALETTTTADTGLTAATTATTMTTAAATLVMEDSPPSYEMALLCPSVHSFMAASSPPAIQLIIPSATSKQQLIEKVVAVHSTAAKTVVSTTTPTPVDPSRRTPSPVNSIKGVISSAAERESVSGAQVLVTADVVTNSHGGQSTACEIVRDYNATATTDHDPDTSEEEVAAECRTETNADNDEAMKSKSLPDSATPSEVVSTTSTSTSTTATSSGP